MGGGGGGGGFGGGDGAVGHQERQVVVPQGVGWQRGGGGVPGPFILLLLATIGSNQH